MTTLRDAGFKSIKAANGAMGNIALGTLNTGEIVIVAKTANSEGYTIYNTYPEALLAFDTILVNAGLQII